MVLVDHRLEMRATRLAVGAQTCVAEIVEADSVERHVFAHRGRLQLVVPEAHVGVPHPVCEDSLGDADSSPELGPQLLRRQRPVRSGHVEGLRLVVGESVHGRHGQAVDQRSVPTARLFKTPIEPGRIDVLRQLRVRRGVVGPVLHPRPRHRRGPGRVKGHRSLQ